MSERDQIKEMVKAAVRTLSEHCDSVRIFVTKHNLDGATDTTAAIDDGGGNFHAQLGQVQEWMDIQKQYQRNWAIRKDAEDQ